MIYLDGLFYSLQKFHQNSEVSKDVIPSFDVMVNIILLSPQWNNSSWWEGTLAQRVTVQRIASKQGLWEEEKVLVYSCQFLTSTKRHHMTCMPGWMWMPYMQIRHFCLLWQAIIATANSGTSVSIMGAACLFWISFFPLFFLINAEAQKTRLSLGINDIGIQGLGWGTDAVHSHAHAWSQPCIQTKPFYSVVSLMLPANWLQQ